MKIKDRVFKYILLSILIMSITLISLPSGAATTRINMTDKLTLTFDDCVDRALNVDENKYQYQNNTLLKRMIDSDGMKRSYDQAVTMKGLAESLYTKFPEYNALLQNKAGLISDRDNVTSRLNSTPDDDHDTRDALMAQIDSLTSDINGLQTQLEGYDAMFAPLLKDTDIINITQDDIFEQYIKVWSSAVFGLESGINSFELSENVVKNSIAQGVRQNYDKLMSLYDTLAFQEKSYEIRDKQYRILISSFLNGQTAEINRIKASIELDQLKVNIDTSKRNIESLKLKLKQQIGVWPEQEIEFKPYRTDDKIKEPLSYDQYLNIAIDKSIEVISAMSDVAAKDNIFAITKKYVIDSSNTDWIEAQIAVEEKAAALNDAKKSVEQDIRSGYNDVLEKKESIGLTRQKVENADVQYQLFKMKYEQGLITESTLWNAELGCIQADMEYQKALRDYNTALYRLEQAIDFGPQYYINTGVK